MGLTTYGPQAGRVSWPGLLVIFTWLDPSAFIMSISKLLSRAEVKAMLAPSGDQKPLES